MNLSRLFPGFLKQQIEHFKRKRRARQLFVDFDAKAVSIFFKNYGWVLPLSFMEKIDVINRKLKPKMILELGSGGSTYIWSKNLQPDAQLITVDESMDFLNSTRQLIGDKPNITYIFPPASTVLNYELLEKFFGTACLPDVLLIDGPKGDRFTPEAVAFYQRLLTPRTLCLIDDTDRPDSDAAAGEIAARVGLKKMDYSDPIYRSHKYSILSPPHINITELFTDLPKRD